MALLYNLARMTTATTGTGTITLGSAVSGFLTFAQSGLVDGGVISYGIQDGVNSEVGTGTYTASGTTLTRSVTNSTNSGSAISLSGNAQVFITALAADFAQLTTAPNAAYTLTAVDRVVASPASLNAPRTWTLPLAALLNAGQQIKLIDLAGAAGSNTITIARAGSDTVNGVSTSLTITTAYSGWLLTSDGSSKWSAEHLAPGFTGTGNEVLATGATMVQPTLGVATVTSVNGLTLSASTGTLTIANAKTLTQSNSLVYSGTDGSTVNFGTGGTVSYSGGFTLGTPQTSGANIDFTGLPSTVKVIHVSLAGVSTSGTQKLQIVLGTGGSPTYTTSGYVGAVAQLSDGGGGACIITSTSYSGGFLTDGAATAAAVRQGTLILTLENSSTNVWCIDGIMNRSDSSTTATVGGSVPLSAALSAVRVTADGIDTIDAGSINIAYAS